MKIEEEIKQSNFMSAQHKALVNVLFTGNWLRDLMAEAFKDADITPQQFNVLRILKGKHPEPLCAGQVKEVMLDKNPDLTRLCDRLMEKGFIKRITCSDNRRKVLLSITEKGMEMLDSMNPILEKQLGIFGDLSSDESLALSDLLDKFRSPKHTEH